MLTITAPDQVAGLAWWPLVVLVLALVAFNIINNRLVPQAHYLLWAIGGSFGVLAIGLLDGNSWTDMGLGWGYIVPGLIWGVSAVSCWSPPATSWRRRSAGAATPCTTSAWRS